MRKPQDNPIPPVSLRALWEERKRAEQADARAGAIGTAIAVTFILTLAGAITLGSSFGAGTLAQPVETAPSGIPPWEPVG